MATVLVVDDDLTLRKLLRHMLRDYKVLEAAEGQEALAIMAKQPCDMIITDCDMAGMGGLELIERIRADQPQFPIMVVSGDLTDARQQKLDQLGIPALSKPYSPGRLLALVACLLA